jgi:hypothetical protein
MVVPSASRPWRALLRWNCVRRRRANPVILNEALALVSIRAVAASLDSIFGKNMHRVAGVTQVVNMRPGSTDGQC